MIRTLLIEDNAADAEALRSAAKDSNEIAITAITDSVIEARQLVMEQDFDAMIIDLELPDGDGASFIFELPTLLPHANPFILVTTQTRSQHVLQCVREQGAYVIQKFNSNYNPPCILQMVSLFSPYFNKHLPSPTPYLSVYAPDDLHKEAVLAQIRAQLEYFGGLPKLTGFKYVVDTTVIFMEDTHGVPSLSKQVYPVLSARYGKDSSSIEHAMRYFIESLWDEQAGRLRAAGVPCDSKTGKCTILDFCCYLANCYRHDYMG